MYISLVNKFAEQAGIVPVALHTNPLVVSYHMNHETMVKFAELIVKECADICMEMSAKCAGLESDGALAKDCADWIKKDFGVE